MKRFSKLTAILMTVILMCALWVPATTVAENPTPATAVQPKGEKLFYFGRSVLAQMDNSDALCYAYDKLVQGCETISDYVDISHRTYTIDNNEAALVYNAVMGDHPEFFWLSDGMSLSGSSGYVTAFLPYVYDDIVTEQAALNARVAELTADLKGKSDAEISRILHDRVCEITVYRSNTYDQSVIGALLKGQAVCAGYARSYQLLMQTMGIPVFHVTGHSKGQGHAWNLVQLDGEWYYTDVTWDDQNDNGGYIYYAYLNLTYDFMAEDHTATTFEEYLPHSTATAANYHFQNNSILETWDTKRLASLYEADRPLRVFVTGDIGAFVNDLNVNFGTLVDEIACPFSGYSGGLSYLGREIWIKLTVSAPHTFVGDTCSGCGHVREPLSLAGDLDGDGDVNNRDLALIQQYINGWKVMVNVEAADVNNDGDINNRDLALIQQYINGWKVTLK